MYLEHEEVAQLGLLHRPFVHPPEAQTLPHAPQLLGSVRRLVHWLLQVAEGALQGQDVSVATAVTVTVVVGVVVSVASWLIVVWMVICMVVSTMAVEVAVPISVTVAVSVMVTVVVERMGVQEESGMAVMEGMEGMEMMDVMGIRALRPRGMRVVLGQMVVVVVLGGVSGTNWCFGVWTYSVTVSVTASAVAVVVPTVVVVGSVMVSVRV